MKVSDLSKKLISEGCNENNFAILSSSHDAICLDKIRNRWIVFYSERGCDSTPLFESESEQHACAFFYNYVMDQRHWHIVGFFKVEHDAIELEKRIHAMDIKPIRNDISAYKTENDPRFRVFVAGKNIFKIREHLSDKQIDYS